MATMVAERSTCSRLRAGAVLVKGRRLIASGYNGSPPGMKHCDDVGHLMHETHCIRTLHGEENTLLQSALFGVSTEGTTCYTTFSPCYHCVKKLIAGGVKRIVAGKMYRDTKCIDACVQSGVKFELYRPDPKWFEYLSRLYGNIAHSELSEQEKNQPL